MSDLEAARRLDDHSSSFGRLRARLVDSEGETYRDRRASMSAPRYLVVWSDIVVTWVALALFVAAAVVVPPRSGWPIDVLVVVIVAAAIGLFTHRLGLFVHEGVHGNIAPGRLNDFMTNVAGGVITITDVRDYRPIHLAHHRHLGTTHDTERSYFERLGARFVVRALTGAHVLAVLRSRESSSDDANRRHLSVLVAGVVFHIGAVIVFALLGWYAAAIAWCVGVASVYPLVQSVRQLLEHRSDLADGSIDYREVDHGPFTRLFSDDRLGPLVGGAGFNRHLLHHWDPNLSYTWFRPIERWVRRTEVVTIVEERVSTYPRTFLRLWGR